jgi:seryl-tRNA synthetase
MLDLKFIRDNPDLVRQALINRNDTAPVDEILELDTRRRAKILELEELRRSRKSASKQYQASAAPGQDAAATGRDLRSVIRGLEDETQELDAKMQALLLQVPNMPLPSVPIGKCDDDDIIARQWQEPRKFDFAPLPHWQLGEALGIIDFERGVKLSGTRFYVLKGLGARLQRAMIQFFLNTHTLEHGYQEIYPPFMVKKEVMYGSGQLPKFADNIYHDAEEDYWFVGTAEIPLTGLHSGEILSADQLPLHYVAYTACFRREKMSAGKDTRGIKRGHQFDKVEMYKLTTPETSDTELESMTHDAEDICRRLGLTYRIRELCTGSIGFGSAKSYDIEVWAPGCGEWLEVSSCSTCTDFQARRANIRFRPAADAKPQFVHTLNGSGLALPRMMIAVIENYQQADGSIVVPEVLQPYMRESVIRKI